MTTATPCPSCREIIPASASHCSSCGAAKPAPGANVPPAAPPAGATARTAEPAIETGDFGGRHIWLLICLFIACILLANGFGKFYGRPERIISGDAYNYLIAHLRGVGYIGAAIVAAVAGLAGVLWQDRR